MRRSMNMQHSAGSINVVIMLAIFLLLQASSAFATLRDEIISTDQNVPIPVIDLQNSITNILNSTPTIVIETLPAVGNSAVAIDCGGGIIQCISYTPAADYVGVDVFIYSVINDNLEKETASITISVGGAIIPDQSIPIVQIENTISKVCVAGQVEVFLLCQAFNNIDPTTPQGQADLRELIKALTPADVAAQGTVGLVLASGQLKNIAKHLAALRKGQQQSSIGGLAFLQNGHTLSGDMLAELFSGQSSGGAASANGVNSPWGWFINGNIGGGDQKETDFENGFDFSTNGLSTGVDYRVGSTGVIGVAFGVASTALDLQHDQGGLDASGVSLIGYGSYYPSQNSYIDMIVSGNSTSFESERRVIFGATNEIANSENDSIALALSLATGYNIVQNGGFTASIDFKADYIKTTIDGYTETGNSPFNVTISEREVTQLTTALGSTMSYAISSSGAVYVPQLDIYWVHQFEEEADIIEGYFSVDPNQTIFRFNANLRDSDYFRLDFGLSAITVGGTTSFAQLGSTVSRSDYTNWHLALGVRIEL